MLEKLEGGIEGKEEIANEIDGSRWISTANPLKANCRHGGVEVWHKNQEALGRCKFLPNVR